MKKYKGLFIIPNEYIDFKKYGRKLIPFYIDDKQVAWSQVAKQNVLKEFRTYSQNDSEQVIDESDGMKFDDKITELLERSKNAKLTNTEE
jgi:hypothetical protein